MTFFNDELNIIVPNNSQWYVYSTPFQTTNTTMYPNIAHAPLHTMFNLQRNIRTSVDQMDFKEKFQALMINVYAPPVSEYYVSAIFENTLKLCRSVPIRKLLFKKDASLLKEIEPYIKEKTNG
jgi:hypothetical protein